MPNSEAYREGHKRIFGDKPRPLAPPRCPDCGKNPCDPNYVHPIRVVKYVPVMETCRPCNEEYPRGEPCPRCGRSLLLG